MFCMKEPRGQILILSKVLGLRGRGGGEDGRFVRFGDKKAKTRWVACGMQ